jgi:hypothetical protein
MPEASSGWVSGGNSANPDPDSLTPTGGAKDYLWVAVEGNDHLDTTSAWPSNYSLYNLEECNGSAGGCNVGVGARAYNASVENPGTFTLDAAEQCVACTVAVHPAAGAQQEGTATANAVTSSSAAAGRVLKGSGLAKAVSTAIVAAGLLIGGAAQSDALSTSTATGSLTATERQYLIPGYGFVDDQDGREYLIPGYGFFNESFAEPAGAVQQGAARADGVSTSTVAGTVVGIQLGTARADGVSSSISTGTHIPHGGGAGACRLDEHRRRNARPKRDTNRKRC